MYVYIIYADICSYMHAYVRSPKTCMHVLAYVCTYVYVHTYTYRVMSLQRHTVYVYNLPPPSPRKRSIEPTAHISIPGTKLSINERALFRRPSGHVGLLQITCSSSDIQQKRRKVGKSLSSKHENPKEAHPA